MVRFPIPKQWTFSSILSQLHAYVSVFLNVTWMVNAMAPVDLRIFTPVCARGGKKRLGPGWDSRGECLLFIQAECVFLGRKRIYTESRLKLSAFLYENCCVRRIVTRVKYLLSFKYTLQNTHLLQHLVIFFSDFSLRSCIVTHVPFVNEEIQTFWIKFGSTN